MEPTAKKHFIHHFTTAILFARCHGSAHRHKQITLC